MKIDFRKPIFVSADLNGAASGTCWQHLRNNLRSYTRLLEQLTVQQRTVLPVICSEGLQLMLTMGGGGHGTQEEFAFHI